jgi:hypothetical protein
MLMKAFTYNQHFVAMMNVINAARLNPPAKGHKHHIVPKCWYKDNKLPVDNSKNNLVLLSYDDHWKVHKLALHCSTTSVMRRNMALAVHRLTEGRYSEPEYWSGKMNPTYGIPRSSEVRSKISSTKKARMNDETKRRISEAMKGENNPMYGKSPSDETRRKRSESLKGTRFSEERRKHISEAMKGKKRNNSIWAKLSDDFKKYTADGGTLKWNDWLHLRKEQTDGK